MKRYTRLPITLYRIQVKMPISLRDYDTQVSKGRSSFDLKLNEGWYHPMDSKTFETPNGCSLRPAGDRMIAILNSFKGTPPNVYRMHEGLKLPEGMVLLHEHTDHYSLQTTTPIKLSEFNKNITEFIQSMPCQSRQQFLDEYYDEDDQDN